MASYIHVAPPVAHACSLGQVQRYPQLAPCYVAAPTFAEACVNLFPQCVSAAAYTSSSVDRATYVDKAVMAAQVTRHVDDAVAMAMKEARHVHDPRSPAEEKERDNMWVVNAVGRGMCVQRIDTPRVHSSPVVCPVCCDASKYSCSSCIAVKKKAAAKAARCDRRKHSLATENACSSRRMRQPMALLKAPNFKLKSKSKVRNLTLKNRAKAFPSAVIESCFHSPADDAQCQVCQSPYDEDKMLLCDKCNAGWHLDCLNPPLATVPSGRWECPICTCIQSCPMKAHPAETGTKRDASKMTDGSGAVFIDLTS